MHFPGRSLFLSLSLALLSSPSPAVAEELVVPGSMPLTAPAGLQTASHIEVRVGDEPVQTTDLLAGPFEDGRYDVVSSVLGAGSAHDVNGDLSKLHFDFGGTIQFDMAVDPTGNLVYGASALGLGLSLFPLETHCWQLPGYESALVDFVKLKSKAGSIAIMVKPKTSTTIEKVSFMQFFTMEVQYGGSDADGNPFSGTLATNPKVATTGNGGGSANNAVAGQGYCHPDGATVYVDASFVRPGRPAGYVEAGPRGAGNLSLTSGLPAHMVDNPGGSGKSSADAIGSAKSTRSHPVSWVTFKFRYTTYVLINCKVVKRIKWHWNAKYTMGGTGGPEYTGDVDSTADVTTYDNDDQAALNGWNAGNYNGAPFVQ